MAKPALQTRDIRSRQNAESVINLHNILMYVRGYMGKMRLCRFYVLGNDTNGLDPLSALATAAAVRPDLLFLELLLLQATRYNT